MASITYRFWYSTHDIVNEVRYKCKSLQHNLQFTPYHGNAHPYRNWVGRSIIIMNDTNIEEAQDWIEICLYNAALSQILINDHWYSISPGSI